MSPKLYAPATDRNRDFILAVLKEFLPSKGSVLEIASGTGQHAIHFASQLPEILWQPSDFDPDLLKSIEVWRGEAGLTNVEPALPLNVTDEKWNLGTFAAVVAINLIHIAPWEACVGLFSGAAKHLTPEGIVFLYGPYFIDEEPIAPSNREFDAYLREENPGWGVRTLKAVNDEAGRHALKLKRCIPMPANNFSLIYTR